MSRIPTDRGYVMIGVLPDGSKKVDIYARRGAKGAPTHLFATHSGCNQVAIESRTRFERSGNSTYSVEPVEVSWDDVSKVLYIRDPARMEDRN
ncbi:hypothetical protein ABZ570_26765 [Micromonospora sp. NPDC007271]|uniref:hypothetical protein n=1 Tax=Micromonospora sp. NPDC007271 TaxID=3154587 RepID=UPI0033FCB315